MHRILTLVAACVAVTTSAAAQDWPSRPLTMVVAFPAGGSDDILARMIAPRLAESLGQPVNVENIDGGGGTGGAPAMRDLVAGRIDYFCPVVTLAIGPIAKQDVKALAVLSRNRAPLFPDLPSAHEQGVADFTAWTWFALFLPKGAQPAV